MAYGDLFMAGHLNDHGETGKIVVTVKNRDELKWIIPLAVVSLLVFANSLGGDFVYDDNRQILRNTLIQVQYCLTLYFWNCPYAGIGVWVRCQMTSQRYADLAAIEVNNSDFIEGSLTRTSCARPAKLFTANDRINQQTDR